MISGYIKLNNCVIQSQGIASTAETGLGDNKVSVVFFGTLVAQSALSQKYNTTNNAQIVLSHYLKKSTKSFEDFEGSYAFAIYDGTLNQLLLVRDRIGTKNIFYHYSQERLVFASTLRQLFVDYDIPAKLDQESLNQIFVLGPARPSNSGVYKDIHAVSSGHYIKYQDGKIKDYPYYNLHAIDWDMNVEDTVEYARNIIINRTNEYLNTDKPYACFLSGGIDSSVLTTIANTSKTRKAPLTTISVDYKDSDTDFVPNNFQPEHDRKYIKIMRDFVDSQHIDIVLDNETLAKAIQDAAIYRGLPGMADIDSSLLLLCQTTKKHFDIAVSGECADEIFGGYPWYHDQSIRQLDGFPWAMDLSIRTNVFDIDSAKANKYISEHYNKTLNAVSYLNNEESQDRRLRELFVLNLNWFGASLLERKEMMSGAAGLQVQMPFTDHRLVEFAYNLPWNLKSLNGREKGIMRQAFKGLLPDSVVNRKKSPYPKTFSPIYYNYVKSKVQDILSTNSTTSQLINKSYLTKLMDTKDPMSLQPWYGQLMRLPQLLGYIVQLDTVLTEFGVKLV
ncbi:MAG: asparagine synthase (glutamine-hydrolyzing) [Clostridiales bacterium]|jgi:asparagine synthase (glutamine-hydrolysing)|nr:asparagine synthase (glutamine-hydrolyzing) [Clostridiales bacterium]